MLEHVHDYFDMKQLFNQYGCHSVIQAKDRALEEILDLVHVR